MRVFYSVLLLLAPVVIPALAYSYFSPAKVPCVTLGAATYQFLPNSAAPDYRVKIERAGAHPDLRLQIVQQPEIADLVIADDDDAAQGDLCPAGSVKTIRVDADETRPDVTIRFAEQGEASDYRIYVHSQRFSQTDIAAMQAVIWKMAQRRDFAEIR